MTDWVIVIVCVIIIGIVIAVKASSTQAKKKKTSGSILAPQQYLKFVAPIVFGILMILVFGGILFPGLASWLFVHYRVGILVLIGIIFFCAWLLFQKQKEESRFGALIPVFVFFFALLAIIGTVRLFAGAQGSNILGAMAGSEVQRYSYVPQEAPWIPIVYTLGDNSTYRVDVPLTRIWTEVRLPLLNGQKVKIIKIEPINAAIPAWYEAGQSGKSNRNTIIRVGERGAQQRRNQYEDWQWIPYRQIWPPTEHFIDSCLCPDGTVFGCPLIRVGNEWHFRIAGDIEVCQQRVDRFYFGIDLPFGQHIAAAGVYRITFSIQ